MNSISANLNVMIKASEKASKILIRDFGELEKLQVSKKGPRDFVTNADIKVEKIIINELKKARPNYSIISEENGIEKNKDKDLLKFQFKFLEVNIHWNNFNKILLKSRCCISMAGTAAEQAIGLGKPVIQIEGKGPQFTKTFAEAQRRLLGKYVFCASNYKDKNDQINQTIKLIIKIIYLIQLNKKFMISCNENAKKRLGDNKACLKMVDDMNIVIKND